MSIERGLGPEELVTVLASRKFAQRVAELALYTRETESEGGLCVYKKRSTGKLTISQPDLPTDEEREEIREYRNYLSDIYEHVDISESKNSYHPKKLLWNPSSREFYRRDVALHIHSHPGGYNHLAPSDKDLTAYEETAGYNPDLIEGVLVAGKSRAKIFLYGQTLTRYALGRYKAKEFGNTPAKKVRELIAQDGFCTTTVEYDIASQRIVTNPHTAAKRYFTSKTR